MNHIGLFEGIGGFSLAARWMGWETIAWCEWNEFGQKVLKHHFPKAKPHGDITKTDFTIYRGQCDVLTGGFPCQPYSLAGKRKGKKDDRHLWPEMLRAIKEIQPTWVVGENVFGLVNWSGGLVFHEVQTDLEAAGYKVFPYVLPACAVNAPHRRDRVWFVAYNNKCAAGSSGTSGGIKSNGSKNNDEQKLWGEQTELNTRSHKLLRDAPNTDSNGQHGSNSQHEINASEGWEYAQRNIEQMGSNDVADTNINGIQGQQIKTRTSQKIGQRGQGFKEIRELGYVRNWNNFPTVPPFRLRDDGVSNKLLRFVVNEFYDTISYTSEKNRIQNLQEVWELIQQEEIWEQIRGLYSLESKNVLLQTMQLYSGEYKEQEFLSPFSEKLCEPILQHLRKHKEFRCSPQGQELEKQRTEQFGDSLSFLPHEVALAARRFETAVAKFEAWHRNESIKAAGNAIVPQVAYQIFKTIKLYNETV